VVTCHVDYRLTGHRSKFSSHCYCYSIFSNFQYIMWQKVVVQCCCCFSTNCVFGAHFYSFLTGCFGDCDGLRGKVIIERCVKEGN
jgi:hypothetical protein